MSTNIRTSISRQGEASILEADQTKRPEPDSLRNAPRCQAQRKQMPGVSCRCPAVRGKTVCRVHGGAKGAGGPKGKRNGAFKHGGWTKEAVDGRRRVSAMLKVIREEAVGG